MHTPVSDSEGCCYGRWMASSEEGGGARRRWRMDNGREKRNEGGNWTKMGRPAPVSERGGKPETVSQAPRSGRRASVCWPCLLEERVPRQQTPSRRVDPLSVEPHGIQGEGVRGKCLICQHSKTLAAYLGSQPDVDRR
ncbi:hypothetical protein MAPG_10967 [Magnaporthiopsis poae ATCC 64411]|uniref:Uncharacterized protein n=1 Tax=Magnaporthiopsis poae (strain ATCC 64411 / 73-15) TaxID=644358 RepID=A0A0C4EE06_MAGP6|nr:hypothetical protein MAPG_10967 [Magnaporthiopsis poae ATCC 64411]